MKFTGPVEATDGLKTQPASVLDLHRGLYVLLPEDIDKEDGDSVPLLVDADYDMPVLWQVEDAFPTTDGKVVVLFDAGDAGEQLEVVVEPTVQVRVVLDGEDHDRWALP